MEEQPPAYFQSKYTTPYYVTNGQAKAPIKCLKTTTRVTTSKKKTQNTLDLYG